MGRVQLWVLPWAMDLKVWRCPQDGFVAASRETAAELCARPEEVALRDHVWTLAGDYGADLEFVRGEAERRLLEEMGGMAAVPRW